MKLPKRIAAFATTAVMLVTSSMGTMSYNPIKLSALSASAADIVASGECGAEGDNVVWQLDSDGTLTISGKGAMIDDPQFEHYDTKNVVIENGVTNIGNFAFYNYPSLTSIIIPDSVASIGEGAFYSCTSLAIITITESVTSIGGEAFFGTPWLDSKREENPLVIVNGILIDGVTCEGDVVIPNSVTSIGNYAFGYCSELTSIKIPDTVTDIGAWAFSNCSGLASILIPDSIKIIGENAFYECTSLTTITIPDSVASIGQEAFYFCDSLTSITIENQDCEIYDQDTTIINNYNEETFEPYFDGTIYGYAGSTAQAYAEKYNRNFISLDEKPAVEIIASGECGAQGDNVVWQLDSDGTLTISGEGEMENWNASYSAPWQLWWSSDISNVIIADGVTSIGSYAFYICENLNSITIPNSVTSIGDYAFCSCNNITSIMIPDSISSIGNGAFKFCEGLTSITIPDSVTSIGEGTFSNCKSLNSIMIPNSVTSIGDYAFYECTTLTSITIPDSVISIGECAFYECTSLTSITIPDSVTYIGGSAFSSCKNLSAINVDTENEYYASEEGVLFSEDKRLLVQYPTGKAAKEYVIPDSVTNIGVGAFGDCTNLTSIIIPDSVTNIGYDAFRGCTGLTTITIPDSVTTMNGGVFLECTSLTSVSIHGDLTSIAEYTFCDCPNLASVTLPDSITSIGEYAFYNCKNLKSITIPDSVTSINNSAFVDCVNLTSVIIPESVISIGRWAFIGTPWLNSKIEENPLVIVNGILIYGITCEGDVVIPNSVTSIGECAFYECTSLTSITIPDSVTSIGGYAFVDCTSLTSIIIPDSVTNIEYDAFSGCTSLTSITIPDSVTNIGYNAFSGCTSLTSITIPDSVTSIGGEAFFGTPWLDSKREENPLVIVNGILIDGITCEGDVIIPNSVTSIGDYAFHGCTNLTSIVIPDSVTNIGHAAFGSCSNLNSITIENSECEISDWDTTIYNGWDYEYYFNGTIYGYEGSTAQAYAEKYNRKFAVIDDEKPVTTSTTITSTTKTTTTTTTSTATTSTTKTTTTRIVTTTAASNDPAFVNGADNWSFSNSRNNFGNSYYMKDEYWNTLMNGLSNIEKEDIKEYVRDSYWGGSCYGMAVTSILASHDILKPNNYQSNANFLNDILSPPNNDVKSIINYYFAVQFTDVMQQQTNISVFTDEKDKLDYIVKCLEDDSPTLLCYFGYFHGFDWGGHAVVAYDVEYGTYSYGGKAYNGKIVTYDNNSVDYDANYCLYFNSSNGNWIIPAYELDSTKESVLGLITDDLKYINYHGYLNGTTNKISNDYIATLRSASLKDNYNLIKANYSNGIWMNSSTSTDDIKVFSSLSDNNFENSDMMFAMKDANSGYIMKTEKLNALDLSMRYENTLLNIDADACQIAKFSPNGYVEIEGEQTSYDIEIVLNDGHMVTDWYGFSVTGDNADKVNLRAVEDGYIMSATDLKNITAEAFNDNVTAEAQFSTDYNSVFLYEIDENTIGISVDMDGDGTYETNINTQPTYTLGDVNDDGTIDASDASLVLAEYAKIQTGGNQTFTEKQTSAADVNTDGVVDASDASKILVYYAAISTGKEPSWK